MTINKKNYRLVCQYCGEEFDSSTHNRSYCSRPECKNKAKAAKSKRIRESMRSLRKWKKRHKTF